MIKWWKEKKVDGINICLILTFATIIILAIVSHFFYWFRGGYPVEVTVAILTVCLTEIVALCKIKLDKNKKADTGKTD